MKNRRTVDITELFQCKKISLPFGNDLEVTFNEDYIYLAIMVNAWAVRPKPHGYNRLEEFKHQNIVAIGWPDYGDLSNSSKSEIRDLIEENHDWSSRRIGQTVGQINRFVNGFEQGDYVIVPSGGDVYIGRVESEYYFDESVAGEDEGYPHQRKVKWKFDASAIDRSSLPGKVYDSLKGRMTVFSLDAERVSTLERPKVEIREGDQYAELQNGYIEKLEEGRLRSVNSASFEDVAQIVLDKYFPNITRQATTSDPDGDTDLKTILPGEVTVRVQVKHFYPDQGDLPAKAVTQLDKSMAPGDNGIVLSSTKASQSAEEAANESEHHIGIIDGPDFVDLIFENIDEFTENEMRTLGLRVPPPEIRK
jgi:predicted Mrr-cat superfamily restriction endonuclease